MENKSQNLKRKQRIEIRCDDKELDDIKVKAILSGESLTNFMIKSAMNKKIYDTSNLDGTLTDIAYLTGLISRLVNQISRIGNAVNEVCNHCEISEYATKEDIDEIKKYTRNSFINQEKALEYEKEIMNLLGEINITLGKE